MNNQFLKANDLACEVFGRGMAWFDAGGPDKLLAASAFIQTVEQRLGLKIACVEEIAFNKGWVSQAELHENNARYQNSDYGRYIEALLNDK